MLAKAISSSRSSARRASTRSSGRMALFPSIDRQHLAGDPAGIVRGEEHHGVSDILRRAEALQRNGLHQLALPDLTVGFPLPLGGRVGTDEARSDVVDRDAPRTQ